MKAKLGLKWPTVSIYPDFFPVMSTAQSDRPFYEEWWFLLVMALVGLILILVLVFALLLHGHNSRYKTCGSGWRSPHLFTDHTCASNPGAPLGRFVFLL